MKPHIHNGKILVDKNGEWKDCCCTKEICLYAQIRFQWNEYNCDTDNRKVNQYSRTTHITNNNNVLEVVSSTNYGTQNARQRKNIPQEKCTTHQGRISACLLSIPYAECISYEEGRGEMVDVYWLGKISENSRYRFGARVSTGDNTMVRIYDGSHVFICLPNRTETFWTDYYYITNDDLVQAQINYEIIKV